MHSHCAKRLVQRPRAKLPGGSGQLLPTLRHASRQGKTHRKRRPPGQSMILVIFQGFSELFGGGSRNGGGVRAVLVREGDEATRLLPRVPRWKGSQVYE